MHLIPSLRPVLAGLPRHADLAPGVLIVAFISFLARGLVGDNYGYF